MCGGITSLQSYQVDRIIFCVFLKVDYKLYRELLHCYFPIEADGGGADEGQTPPPEETADRERGELGEEEEGSSPVMPGLDRSITEPGMWCCYREVT